MKEAMPTCNISWQPIGKRSAAPEAQTLLAAAQAVGIGLSAVCGGTGTCSVCRVRVTAGAVSPLTATEAAALSPAELAQGYRLVCQCYPYSDLRLEIPLIR